MFHAARKISIIMIGVFALVLALAAPTFGRNTRSGAPTSPCPGVFTYEPPGAGAEPGEWFGVISLTTDITLHSLLLNIVLDGKVNLLENRVGAVSTENNIDFKIENLDFELKPGSETLVRFHVKFDPFDRAPRLKIIKLNGREICNIDTPRPNIDKYEELRLIEVETTTKMRRWEDIWPEDVPLTRSNNEVIWKKLNPKKTT